LNRPTRTPTIWGLGLPDGEADGLALGEGDGFAPVPGGCAALPPVGKAWSINTTPPTTRATMSANRSVLVAKEK
jgi:hypothetical protein